MARSHRRVHQIAKLISSPVDVAVKELRKLGIEAKSDNDLLAENDRDKAFAIFGINRLNPKPVPPPREAKKPALKVRKKRAPRALSWPVRIGKLIGHRAPHIEHLDAYQVGTFHWFLVEEFEGTPDPITPPGVTDSHLLWSALFRAQTSLGGVQKYPTVPMAAAAYTHALIHDHPFHNGNKRTALVTMLAFLDLNGMVLNVRDETELFDFLVAIADHRILRSSLRGNVADRETLEIARWIHGHSRTLSNREKCLSFRQLRRLLAVYACECEVLKGNRINITRDNYRTQVAYRNEGAEVERNTIRKIRQDLHLTEEEGYDSTIFYGSLNRIPEFIQRYRDTFRRLAKM